ncbi:phosphoglycolate phosphatase [Rhodothalassium salexigens]|uniref:phosphoglycolate phosphatase n=1 Tax=Rhodothalassium salexigens TaxID=1086 RepID=UPI0019143856|nr:phosphoglycolate phosphatase [Rhodothalassium salexigens]MBK5910226.1 phosphoglycolate phosphatase [Rhodothalassium salexigens]MBK5920567.1 phosphoglycolate phosphatase [Rhodothalassium salexigens]
MAPLDCRNLILDLDGTLVDSAPDLTRALNHVLASLDRPALDPQTVRHMVGQGAAKLIERGLAHTGGGDGVPPVADLLPGFLDFYGAHIADGSRPFPGAVDLLDRARAAGLRLGLCTNKPQAMTEALMDALDLSDYFDVMIGGDVLSGRKPDPVHLDTVCARLGDGPAVLLGDTATDVAAGRASGVPVGVVSFGFSATPAADLGGDFLIDSFAAVDAHLAPLARPARV